MYSVCTTSAKQDIGVYSVVKNSERFNKGIQYALEFLYGIRALKILQDL